MKNFWLISVDMGYGHQRTAFPLKNFAFEFFNANNYPGIPKQDRKIWETSRRTYEFISRFSQVPLIGKTVFSVFDLFQKISNFYPQKKLTKPNFSLKNIYSLIKRGWGKELIERLKNKNPKIPLLSTFFIPAFMAEEFGYPGEIFCIVCDTDVSRSWVPLFPDKSKIKYFSPTERVLERLKLYGIKPENIFLTGYPLPLENIGSEKMETLKEDLKNRLFNLDPKRIYYNKYKDLIESQLGKISEGADHPLTILFSIGGAGAQKEIGLKIVKKFFKKIKEGKIKIILSAGIKPLVKNYFLEGIKKIGLEEFLGKTIEIIFEKDVGDYFRKFNLCLRKADVLWTKPSELSFYSALGIPIIIAPPIGSQEEFNMRWLLKSGFGILQENPDYVDQWFFDWLNKGYLAEMAVEGFIEGEKLGTYKILKIIEKFQ